MIKKNKLKFIFTCFLLSSICILFVALMNFLDGNTTIGITFLLLRLSFLLLSTTHLKKGHS